MPEIEIPKKLEPLLTTKKRFVVVVGGRSSAKSETLGRVLLMRSQTEAADVLCGREFQESIDDSVHKLIKSLINKLKVKGFSIQEKKIDCLTGGGFRFRGFARNPDAVKSAQDFKYSWIEEAQKLSQESIDELLPTIRSEGSQLFFSANPGSSADPFSKRFIVPYLNHLKLYGIYEDDLHLVIMCNWRDNPWHGELEAQRQWDYDHLPRAKYDHIWEGDFGDSIEDALILAEWFDTCIDAHKRIGFEPRGIRFAAHDPSDNGPDDKGFAFRHGSILLDLQDKSTGDINEGADWATGLAINHQADAFTWDCDGMGVGLNRQISSAFEGKQTVVQMFKGSNTVHLPDAIYKLVGDISQQKKNKEAFKNRRAQCYFMLRDRILSTYRAIEFKEYTDPDGMLSFDSSLKLLPKLRSELCRMPVKPNNNGMFELYTKEQMKTKFKLESPNLADSVMMLMIPPDVRQIPKVMPQPIRPMGITRSNRMGQMRARV